MSPMANPDLRKLCSALTKSGTRRPAKRTPIMPCEPFYELFKNWPEDRELDVLRLRLKVITLLALSLMTRPSDLAPKSMLFHGDTQEKEPILFTRDQVIFNADGSATITLFAIKNDRNRSGFEVRLPRESQPEVDPI